MFLFCLDNILSCGCISVSDSLLQICSESQDDNDLL